MVYVKDLIMHFVQKMNNVLNLLLIKIKDSFVKLILLIKVIIILLKIKNQNKENIIMEE